MDTRPTSDRLRESLFNILGGSVRDARVLDLYAGTGALGLEALSRGAQTCVFVDNQKKALSVIRKNIASCGLESASRVICWNLSRNLSCVKDHEPHFDLVFLDPPYSRDLIPKTLQGLIDAHCLDDGALIVCEHDGRDTLTSVPLELTLTDHRRYGRTGFSFFCFHAPG